jgi:hypothetical protein
MTARSPFTFPGDRTFAGWWRQFSPLRPTGIWAGHILIQHIELLTQTEVPIDLDPLSRFLLEEINRSGAASVERLRDQLHLGDAYGLLLDDLAQSGLVSIVENACELTQSGRHALEHGFYLAPRYRRQSFRFLDLRPHAEPYRIAEADTLPKSIWPENLNVQQGLTIEAVRPFLPEVTIISLTEMSGPTDVWQRIPVIRADRLSVAVVLVASEAGPQLHLLGLKPESWTVPVLEPLLTLPGHALPSTSATSWQRAWKDWCVSRQIPEDEITACTLERDQHRLRIQAPQSVLDRLKAARSDVFKGDSWLVAGEGLWREGALIVLNA